MVYSHIDETWSILSTDFSDYKISSKKDLGIYALSLIISQNMLGLYRLRIKALTRSQTLFQIF